MSNFFDSALTLYRRTFKRVRPIHAGIHWLLTRTALPLLERVKRLETMPDDPFWFRLELLTGQHEKETLVQVQRLVKPGMVVLDIGAHIGYYARRFAAEVGDGGRVICFEPHPRTAQTLTRNIAGAGNVTVVSVAVSDSEGTAELYDYLMMSASGSLHYDESLRDLQRSGAGAGDIAPRLARDMPVEKFTVRTATVDRCLEELGIERVNVVKMDIEGAEMSALRGMRETIRRSPGLALIMEYNPQALSASGLDPVAAIHDVLAFGFKRVSIIEKDGTLTAVTGAGDLLRTRTAAMMGNMAVVNLLFESDE